MCEIKIKPTNNQLDFDSEPNNFTSQIPMENSIIADSYTHNDNSIEEMILELETDHQTYIPPFLNSTETGINIETNLDTNPPFLNSTETGINIETNLDTNPPTVKVIKETTPFKLIYTYEALSQGDGLDGEVLSEEGKEYLISEVGLTEEEVNQLGEKCSSFSIDHGCGGYALIAVLNGYFHLNITKFDFFFNTLRNAIGNNKWVNSILGKKDESGSYEVINIKCMEEVLNYLNLDYIKLSDYTVEKQKENGVNDFLDNENSNYEDVGKIFREHLESGKPAIIQVSRLKTKDNDYNPEKTFTGTNKAYAKEFLEAIATKEKEDNTWTNYAHYLVVTGIDAEGYLTIIDSRVLPDIVTENGEVIEYNHIRKVPYEDFAKYIGANNPYEGCILLGAKNQ